LDPEWGIDGMGIATDTLSPTEGQTGEQEEYMHMDDRKNGKDGSHLSHLKRETIDGKEGLSIHSSQSMAKKKRRTGKSNAIRVYVTDLEECMKKMTYLFTENVSEDNRVLSGPLRGKVAQIQQENNGLLASMMLEESGITGSVASGGKGSRRSTGNRLSMTTGRGGSARLSYSADGGNTTRNSGISQCRRSGVSLADEKMGDGTTTADMIEFLLEAPVGLPGNTFAKLSIDRIGLKDAPVYVDPFLEITLVDGEGQCLEQSQRTAPSFDRAPTFVRFSTDVFIQTPIGSLPEGSAIFFEFKHYKPKKKMISTRCYAFLPAEHLQDGSHQLKLYRKPTQWRRKKLKGHTKKPLFLYVNVEMLRY